MVVLPYLEKSKIIIFYADQQKWKKIGEKQGFIARILQKCFGCVSKRAKAMKYFS